jgi:hypothetical protein
VEEEGGDDVWALHVIEMEKGTVPGVFWKIIMALVKVPVHCNGSQIDNSKAINFSTKTNI